MEENPGNVFFSHTIHRIGGICFDKSICNIPQITPRRGCEDRLFLNSKGGWQIKSSDSFPRQWFKVTAEVKEHCAIIQVGKMESLYHVSTDFTVKLEENPGNVFFCHTIHRIGGICFDKSICNIPQITPRRGCEDRLFLNSKGGGNQAQ